MFDWELHENILELHRTIPELRTARNRRDRVSTGLEKLNELEKKFYCDQSDRDPNYDHQEDYREISSIIDANGRQTACLSGGHLARTPKLDLGFREYFEYPKEGALWHPKLVSPPEPRCRLHMATDRSSLIPCLIPGSIELWRSWHELDRMPSATGRPADRLDLSIRGMEVPYILERIDSVVRGDVQTILAISTECDDPRAEGGCAEGLVVATTARLNSLDRAVPPPHVDFAVVDQRTGRTLFHSDDDLAMVTNFAEDVSGDPALWTLLRTGALGTVSLVYAGIPVRAHVRPLREGTPWGLIVYRGHEIEDRLTSVTTALAVFFALLPLFFFTTVAGVVLFVAYLREPASIASFPICLSRVMAAGASFGSGLRWAATVAMTGLILAFLVWIQGFITAAVARWLILPLAVGSVIAVFLLLAWRICQTTERNGCDADAVRQVWVVSLVIVFLGTAPAGLWFSHHRAELGGGLNHYLMDRTLESIDRAREEYRLQRLREYGGGIARRDDRTSGQPYVERTAQRPGGIRIYAWLLDMLRPVVGLSGLSNDLIVYRILPPAPAVGAASLHGVFARTFGYKVRPWVRRHLVHVLLELVVWLFLVAALIGFIAHSIRTIVTRRHGEPMHDAEERLSSVTGCSGPISPVPPGRNGTDVSARGRRTCIPFRGFFHRDPVPQDERLASKSGRPLRAVVLSRNPENRGGFIKKSDFESKLIDGVDFKCLRKHEWTGKQTDKQIEWKTTHGQCSDASKDLYVFDDLEKVLERSAEGRALFAELERRVAEKSPVLVWSDVVHDYRYSERFGPVDAWFRRGSPDDADRRRRWERLAGRLDPYVLGISHPPCSVSEFERLWGQSTFDERLELHALARGGVAGSRRPTARATLSSLKSRGIVEVDRMGVVKWPCEKFGKEFSEFILRDADRQELAEWQDEGRGGLWQFIWPPVLIGAALMLTFLFLANPEMQSTLLALLGLLPARESTLLALLALLPALLALFRGGRLPGQTSKE